VFAERTPGLVVEIARFLEKVTRELTGLTRELGEFMQVWGENGRVACTDCALCLCLPLLEGGNPHFVILDADARDAIVPDGVPDLAYDNTQRNADCRCPTRRLSPPTRPTRK